jgi:hypothetical protein
VLLTFLPFKYETGLHWQLQAHRTVLDLLTPIFAIFGPFFDDFGVHLGSKIGSFLHTGKPHSNSATHDFKAVRSNKPKQLEFLRDAFPNAKIISNFRIELLLQSQSAW